MRLIKYILLLTLTSMLLLHPASAQTPARSLLEQENRIWLRTSVPTPVQHGLLMPHLSYVRFKDGKFWDEIAYSHHVIGPVGCIDRGRTCPESVKSTAVLKGHYSVTNGRIDLEGATISPLSFERPEFTGFQMVSVTFSGGKTSFPLLFEDDALVRFGRDGKTFYRAADMQDIALINGLWRMTLTLGVEENACLAKGHLARKSEENPDGLSRALLAMAHVGARTMEIEDEISDLTQRDTIRGYELGPTDSARFHILYKESYLTNVARDQMIEAYIEARNISVDAALPAIPDLSVLAAEILKDDLDTESLSTVLDQSKATLQHVQTAMPALFVLKKMDPLESKGPLLCYTTDVE